MMSGNVATHTDINSSEAKNTSHLTKIIAIQGLLYGNKAYKEKYNMPHKEK